MDKCARGRGQHQAFAGKTATRSMTIMISLLTAKVNCCFQTDPERGVVLAFDALHSDGAEGLYTGSSDARTERSLRRFVANE
jgi:hypothetical protein